jgi:hypothetical protein
MKTVEEMDAAWDELCSKGNVFLYGSIDVRGILNVHVTDQKTLHGKDRKLSELLGDGVAQLRGKRGEIGD